MPHVRLFPLAAAVAALLLTALPAAAQHPSYEDLVGGGPRPPAAAHRALPKGARYPSFGSRSKMVEDWRSPLRKPSTHG